jgi:hypothetical protein
MKYITGFLAAIVLGALFFGVIGFTTMNLWNWLVPSIFGLPRLCFCQALGLFILCRILLGGFGFPRASYWQHKKEDWKDKMHDKWQNMSQEERDEWRNKLDKFCDK